MNGSPASTISTPTTANLLSTEQIDASCRVLLIPILSGLVWLFISSLLMLITSVKLHSPAILANCAWLTYGHTRPAANDAFVYGFASQAGLAVALWILCRLGRTTLVGIVPIAIGSIFWNLGVTLGLIGIFTGHTTGFDWLEFPECGLGGIFLRPTSSSAFADCSPFAAVAPLNYFRRNGTSSRPCFGFPGFTPPRGCCWFGSPFGVSCKSS